MGMLLGLVPVLPPPCGWEHRTAGEFPMGWQVSLTSIPLWAPLVVSSHLWFTSCFWGSFSLLIVVLSPLLIAGTGI